MTEDEMVGWHHRLDRHEFDRHEFEQTPEVGDGQQNLACCSPWGHEESDLTWHLNSNNQLFRVRKLPSPLWMEEGHREGV